jgi:uncharacterized coiled-coil protein SlyX
MKTITKIVYVVLALLAVDSFALLQRAQAVLPAPDGGYPGGNTAEGQQALLSLSGGGFNTAVGFISLRSNITGGFNTAIGAGALPVNTADRNTATGAGTLFHNTDGIDNTANGTFALFNNIGGYSNTATGVEALGSNFAGYENTANGVNALVGNTYGIKNTAAGVDALLSNVIGDYNTALGFQALYHNTGLTGNSGGSYNTAVGGAALFNNTGGANIGLGFNAGVNLTTGDLNIDIGNTGLAGESKTIRIGSPQIQTATYVAGIFGAIVTDGAPVLVDTNGHLGTAVSSARFKNDIKPMDKASEAILSLKPVAFRYKTDTKGTPQFGLIAEEVAKVNPDLVVRDEDGKPYTIRYDQVNAMLLNEFLKEHRKVEAQQATIAELKSTVAQQQDRFGQQEAQIQALTSGFQKVSAQLEVRNHAPQTVVASSRPLKRRSPL